DPGPPNPPADRGVGCGPWGPPHFMSRTHSASTSCVLAPAEIGSPKTMLDTTRREFAGLALALGVRIDRSGSAKIDETLRAGIARRKIPAAGGMVASESETLYEGAFGTRDSSGAPVRIDSIFGIASMTKAITTVAALQLVERGTLQVE